MLSSMASSASDIQAVLITLMTPIGPLCNCWMMPEETLHRQEKKAREQPEKEILSCRPKKKKKSFTERPDTFFSLDDHAFSFCFKGMLASLNYFGFQNQCKLSAVFCSFLLLFFFR